MGWILLVAVVTVCVMVVVVLRTGLLFRWPAFLRWRIAKSRRDRGKGTAEPPDPGSDPTSGVF